MGFRDSDNIIEPIDDGNMFDTDTGATAISSTSEAAASAFAAANSAEDALAAKIAAELAETNAETAETNAETAETNASTSATNAATSETNASTSETNASASASAAASSAADAQSSEDDAEVSETNAANSAAAALVSENNASSSETNAATSAVTSATQAGISTTKAGEAFVSAAAALVSENNASTSETNAATSETNAATSESNAAASKTNAATSATNAATSETNAATSATNAADSETNAATSETAASASETAAAASETASASSATNAAGSASSALNFQTQAGIYSSNAASSASSALSSKNSASSFATSSANSATSASNSASTATTKAIEAATSATNASTSETNAATSATNAATSETNASTSETNASNSANSATNSATAAQTAQAATELVFDNFDDKFLGTKSSDPSVDNDGNALVEGAMYYNSSSNAIKFYNGSSWEAPSVAASNSATAAATSATNSSNSASAASTSASNAANSATSAATSETNAATSATNSSNSASTATTQASNAATSATNASNSATAAATSETNASNSASASATSASAASTSASNASTSETNAATSEGVATTQAGIATTKAGEASTSATNAATSATNAAASASTATTKASEASTSASNAATSETNAATSATNAATSETNSSNSATASASSASAASTSETNAATSETNAGNSATASASSASAASTSETNAATSASGAATSATNASNSATAAQTAQTAAETALDSFDDRYLGEKSSDPTVDNDGDALITGALYFSTGGGSLKVYDGTQWNPTAATTESIQDVVGSLITGTTGVSATYSDLDNSLTIAGTAATTSAAGTMSAADKTKLDGIESSADVTDIANVTAAGALMDSEVTNLAQVKAFDSADYATAAQGALADSALQSYTVSEGDVTAHEAALSITESQISDLGSYLTAHPNITAASSVNNTGRTYIQDITLDSNGHITGLVSATETVTDTTYTSSDFNHDSLTGFVANEHIDWTTDQGATNIHSGNYTNTTYSVGDGGLTQKNFTTTLKTKLDGIAASATNTAEPAIITNGSTPSLASGITAAEVRSLIGAGTSSSNNATHTGEVTGSSALTIADNVVDAGNLKVTGNGTTSQFLRSDGDGSFTWATPSDTNTTYSVGDGGLTQKNFTTTLKNKLDGISAGATDNTVANAALPKAGGTMTGDLKINKSDAAIYLNDTSGSPTQQGMRIRAEAIDSNLPGSEGIGIVFEEDPANGSPDTTPAVITTGEFYSQSNQRVFHDGYHPNADDADTLDGQHGIYYTEYTDTAISNLVDSSPATLDTLNELAAALGDDPNFATTVATNIGAKVSKSGDTMTGDLQLNARLDVGSGTQNDAEIRIYKGDNNVSDHIQFYNGTTRMGEIGCEDTSWLRINQETAKNIYTPRYIRADGGLFVDGTTKGINGSGNFIGGTITGASDANVSNWDAAYTTANAALPKAGGTMTGGLIPDTPGDYDQTAITSLTNAPINYPEVNVGSSDTYLPAFHMRAVHSGGYRTHMNVGLHKDNSGWGNNSTGFYVALGGSDNNPTEAYKLTYGGQLNHTSAGRFFADNYHPNADKWTTARTLTLSGDASGSVSWDGSANATLSVTVANDSHTHDGRYYTETEADSRFVNASGDNITGDVTFNSGANIHRNTHSSGFLVGSYNSVGANGSNTNPIYTIGSSYQPNDGDLVNMYGIGYTTGSAAYDGINNVLSGWGMYVAADGDARIGLDAQNGIIKSTGVHYVNTNQRVFADNYHPNADKWTTARTLSLSGDASGSVSWDGSANASLSVTVANDSHNHSSSSGNFTVGGDLIATDILPPTDNTGVVGNSSYTWNNGQFTNLQINSTLTVRGAVDLADNDRIRLGSGDDFQMWHDGTSTYFRNYLHAAGSFYWQGEGTGGTNHNLISMHNDLTTPYVRLYYDSAVVLETVSGGVNIAGNTAWHAGNDGSGSGLDADLLDGNHASAFATSAQGTLATNALPKSGGTLTGDIVSNVRNKGVFGTYDSTKTDHIWSMGTAYRNHASGTNFGNLYGLAYKHTNNTTGGAMASGHQMVWCQNGTPYSAMGTNIWTSGSIIVDGTVDGRDVSTDGTKLDGIESGATADQTASEILTAIKTVDGSGSGLDADTVDGIQASSFLRSDTNDTHAGTLSLDIVQVGNELRLPSNTSLTDVTLTGVGDEDTGFNWSGSNAVNYVSGGVLKYNLNNVWHSGNDGSGSGLDADTVDGVHESTFMRKSANSNLDMNNNNITDVEDIYLQDRIYHDGDTTTYIQFNLLNTWRVVTGGSTRLTVNNSAVAASVELRSTGNVIAYYSDERLKTKVGVIENAVEKVKSLDAFYYVENDLAKSFGYNNDKKQVALSAQGVQKVLPEAVTLAPFDMEDNPETGETFSKSGENYLTVDYAKMVPLLVQAIKELKAEIEELRGQ